MGTSKSYVRKARTVDPVPCPCGSATRIVTSHDDSRVSIHRVEISREAKKHYHGKMTEYYVILDGSGEMELDDDRVTVAPGDLIEIPPGTRHRALGQLRVLVVAMPGFNRDDEFFD